MLVFPVLKVTCFFRLFSDPLILAVPSLCSLYNVKGTLKNVKSRFCMVDMSLKKPRYINILLQNAHLVLLWSEKFSRGAKTHKQTNKNTPLCSEAGIEQNK